MGTRLAEAAQPASRSAIEPSLHIAYVTQTCPHEIKGVALTMARVGLGLHCPSDVLGGALIGLGSTATLLWLAAPVR